MTYAGLLLRFIVVPIIVLALLVLRDRQRRREGETMARGWSPYLLVAALIVVAILYTMPWDSHLIATKVWSYRRTLVSGVNVGGIPVEELLFFPLQTLLVSLWFLWLVPRLVPRVARGDAAVSAAQRVGETVRGTASATKGRLLSALVGSGLWLIAFVVLRLGWQPGTYLGWELVWALPPIIIQLSLGGDILWRRRRLVLAVLIPAILFLSAVDTLAIHEGIWTIDPHQSLDILIGGQLPLEEALFFSLTSVLVVFGLVLGLASESRRRLQAYHTRLAISLGRG